MFQFTELHCVNWPNKAGTSHGACFFTLSHTHGQILNWVHFRLDGLVGRIARWAFKQMYIWHFANIFFRSIVRFNAFSACYVSNYILRSFILSNIITICHLYYVKTVAIEIIAKLNRSRTDTNVWNYIHLAFVIWRRSLWEAKYEKMFGSNNINFVVRPIA